MGIVDVWVVANATANIELKSACAPIISAALNKIGRDELFLLHTQVDDFNLRFQLEANRPNRV